jgi:hypothetical protein
LYKDKEKQRVAVREAVRRHRERAKGITEVSPVIPERVIPDIPPDAWREQKRLQMERFLSGKK